MQADMIIVGGGPAGLTAGIYAARAGLNVLVVEKAFAGGQIATTDALENYPGFATGVTGVDFSMAMHQQAENAGVNFIYEEVSEFHLTGPLKKIITTSGEHTAYATILCMGAEPRLLNIPGETDYRGKGVSYCATCDGAFYKEKTVAIIGGGDTACEEAMYLSNIAKKVYIIHRRDQFRAAHVLSERVLTNPKIEVLWDTLVDEVVGEDKVKSLSIRNKLTGQTSSLEVDGVFVAVGTIPNTDNLNNNIRLNDGNYIITDQYMATNVLGVYAAGDVRNTPLRQVVTACADGAIASETAREYLNEHLTD